MLGLEVAGAKGRDGELRRDLGIRSGVTGAVWVQRQGDSDGREGVWERGGCWACGCGSGCSGAVAARQQGLGGLAL